MVYVAVYAVDLAAENNSGSFESRVTFRVNQYDIDDATADNATSLEAITGFINRVRRDTTMRITTAVYTGYASPEGSRTLNASLSRRRMATLRGFVEDAGLILADDSVSCRSAIADMAMFAAEIKKSDIPHRREALDIIDDTVAMPSAVRRIGRLRRASGGLVWKELIPLLERLRYATVTFNYIMNVRPDKSEAIEAADTAVIVQAPAPLVSDSVPLVSDSVSTGWATAYPPRFFARKPLYISLKTNGLYDLLLIPSVGAEVWLGRMMSINANWSYAWWSKNSRHNYWRYYGGDIALRRWFGRLAKEKPLTGHHIGLYAQIMTYDFEHGGKGYMGDKFNYGCGMEYGFSLPLARRFNIDFTVGIGYLWGKYYEYTPIDGHYVWQTTKRRQWFGPTKAEISLVWLIGHGNVNRPRRGKAAL